MKVKLQSIVYQKIDDLIIANMIINGWAVLNIVNAPGLTGTIVTYISGDFVYVIKTIIEEEGSFRLPVPANFVAWASQIPINQKLVKIPLYAVWEKKLSSKFITMHLKKYCFNNNMEYQSIKSGSIEYIILQQ